MRSLPKLLSLVIIAMAFLAAGCEGPTGPQGEPGEEGEKGERGERGPQGPPGNANVMVETFTFTAADLEAQGSRLFYTQSIDSLDAAVVDSGTVQAFIERFDGGYLANATVDINKQNSVDGKTITVAEAYLPAGGFIAIHDTTLLNDEPVVVGSVIGVSAKLAPGTHENIEVMLFEGVPGADFERDELGEDQPLIAMPHFDSNDNDTYDFVTSEGDKDGPYTSAGSAIVDVATVSVGSDAEVEINAQTSPDGRTITVDFVYLPRDGYIAVHDTTGSVIGVSGYLEAGTHALVEIELFSVPGQDFPADTTLPGTQPVIVMPHEETSGNMEYNFVTSGGEQDGPYFVNDNPDQGAVIDEATITVGGGEASVRSFASRRLGPSSGFILSDAPRRANVNGNAGSVWVALPYSVYPDLNGDGIADAIVQIAYSYDVGELSIEFAAGVPGTALANVLNGEFSVKAVLIPPAEEGGDGGGSSLRVRYDTYAEAAEALGLPLEGDWPRE